MALTVSGIVPYRIQSTLCLAATQGNHKKWLLRAGGSTAEVNISAKLKFGNILFV